MNYAEFSELYAAMEAVVCDWNRGRYVCHEKLVAQMTKAASQVYDATIDVQEFLEKEVVSTQSRPSRK